MLIMLIYVDLCSSVLKNIGFMLCFGELLKIGFRMIGFILCFGITGLLMVVLYCVFEAPIRPERYLQ